jgi:hypothetical protein
MNTRTSKLFRGNGKWDLCIPVDAVGVVVGLEVTRQRAGLPVVADEHHVFPCFVIYIYINSNGSLQYQVRQIRRHVSLFKILGASSAACSKHRSTTFPKNQVRCSSRVYANGNSVSDLAKEAETHLVVLVIDPGVRAVDLLAGLSPDDLKPARRNLTEASERDEHLFSGANQREKSNLLQERRVVDEDTVHSALVAVEELGSLVPVAHLDLLHATVEYKNRFIVTASM